VPVSLATAHEPLYLVDMSITPRERGPAWGGEVGKTAFLQRDLVRQWRDGLQRRVVDCGVAIALVRADKALLLAGMARESGLSACQSQVDHGIFRVELVRTRQLTGAIST